jgi:predicted dehydrogenase
MINIGIIGCGYWGPNLLRNFSECPDCTVTRVAELDSSRIEYLNQKFPQVITTKDHTDLLKKDTHAIVIATQASTHYKLAKEAMLAGKHVLVEKPLAMTVKEAEELVAISRKKKLKLMSGHTFEFNEAVRELKRLITNGTVGKPYYFYSQRLNLGIVRQDVNALWNLAPHDISILIYLIGENPVSVCCHGYDFIQDKIEDVIFMVLHFPNDIIAHVQVSWLDPHKVRKMTVVGSEKMVVYDDMADSKVQVFDKGIKKKNITDSMGRYDDFGKYQLIKTAGDVAFPKIDFVEPLKEECFDFIASIIQDRDPLTNGENGLNVVRVLEAAQKSLDRRGEKVDL